MQRREFCFTLPGDVFVRYQSFKDDKELRKELKSKLPSKIDIGPVFNGTRASGWRTPAGPGPTACSRRPRGSS